MSDRELTLPFYLLAQREFVTIEDGVYRVAKWIVGKDRLTGTRHVLLFTSPQAVLRFYAATAQSHEATPAIPLDREALATVLADLEQSGLTLLVDCHSDPALGGNRSATIPALLTALRGSHGDSLPLPSVN